MDSKKIVAVAVVAIVIAAGTAWFAGSHDRGGEPAADRDTLYQAALLQSLMLGGYDGFITVEELKEHGDIGLGTFDAVNGEMIVLDGVVYQALGDGTVIVASDDTLVPFSTVTFFETDHTVTMGAVTSMDEAKTALTAVVEEKGANQFWMVKFEGTFDTLTVRSELAQTGEYRPLDEVMKTDQRIYEHSDIAGTVVALYCPDCMDGLNAPGWHLHFISADRTVGGHVLDLSYSGGPVQYDMTAAFEMVLPDTDEFNEMDLTAVDDGDVDDVEG